MRLLTIVLSLGLAVATTSVTAAPVKKSVRHAAHHAAKGAKTAKNGKTAKTAKAAGDLKTDVSFDDSVLHGQYQTPDEALARVGNENGFGDLVGVRKHFKDRLHQASEQE